jgi:hypothetical protein
VSDEKQYTEREVVERERAAFVTGFRHFPALGVSAEQAAANAYPLPKRRKVVQVEGCEYRLSEDGERLEVRDAENGPEPWETCEGMMAAYASVTIARARAIVALNGQVWDE